MPTIGREEKAINLIKASVTLLQNFLVRLTFLFSTILDSTEYQTQGL